MIPDGVLAVFGARKNSSAAAAGIFKKIQEEPAQARVRSAVAGHLRSPLSSFPIFPGVFFAGTLQLFRGGRWLLRSDFYQFVTLVYSTFFKLLFQIGTSVGIFFFSILQLF